MKWYSEGLNILGIIIFGVFLPIMSFAALFTQEYFILGSIFLVFYVIAMCLKISHDNFKDKQK